MDSLWEQEKLEARKLSKKAAESPASSARFVGHFRVEQDSMVDKKRLAQTSEIFTHNFIFGNDQKPLGMNERNLTNSQNKTRQNF